jgi:hypothetical protein
MNCNIYVVGALIVITMFLPLANSLSYSRIMEYLARSRAGGAGKLLEWKGAL